jgi:hypothetical protein
LYPFIDPPWDSTIFFEMYKPRPVPVSDFVANFSNNLGNIWGSITLPSYFIRNTTNFYLSLLLFLLLSQFFHYMRILMHSLANY